MRVCTCLNCSSMLFPSCSMPAAARILRLRSSALFLSCAGCSSTTALDTMTEQTMHSANATISVLRMLSLPGTGKPPPDISLHHEMIDQRSEQVGEQNREHDAFGV